MKATRAAEEPLSFAGRVGALTLPVMAVATGVCGWRWGWHSALALLVGAALGGLCLLGHTLFAVWAPALCAARPKQGRGPRTVLAAFILLKMLVVLGVLGGAVCWLRLPPAELAVGYTATLVVIDNLAAPGDACLQVPGLGLKMGPTSTSVGCAILHCVAMETVALLVERGHTPPVFMPANYPGGSEYNERLIEKYGDRVNYLK